MDIRLKISADKQRFNLEIDNRFRRFQQAVAQSSLVVSNDLKRETGPLVVSRLSRFENVGRHTGSLATAINESIEPYSMGRRNYGVGIRIVDEATLTRGAAYWHAIEVGSRHVVDGNIRVVGFGVRRGTLFSAKLTRPGASTGQPDAIASKTVGVPVKNPIKEHEYLKTISQRAASRFSARVGADLTQAFS